jgi:hypothetical protein
MLNRQLNLSLEERVGQGTDTRPRRRSSRARWWFAQMRLAADGALSWQTPAPADHPRQLTEEFTPLHKAAA